jgi:16S rRNA processing protein RimM
MTSMADAGLVIVGRIRKVHGLRGEVIVEALTDEPDAVFASGRRVFAATDAPDHQPVASATLPELHVVAARPHGGGLRVTFAEIEGRTAAERWRDRYLYVPSAELTPLAEGETYLHELDGMTVELSTGEVVGRVVARYELPQGLVLEVERPAPSGGTVLVPYDRVVTSVDRSARVVRIDPPLGLLD